MRTLLACAALLVLAVSGCLQGGGGSPGNVSDAPSPTASSVPRAHHAPTTAAPPPSPSTAPDPPRPVRPTQQAPWPDIASATIRPGVQTADAVGQCTTNFLFRSPDNATLYLGIAAHCVNGMKLGDAVDVEGASAKAKLAYSSWIAQGVTDCVDASGTLKDDEKCNSDFSLVAIDAKDRAKVHPAVLHFGGPTALMDSKELDLGDRVLGYGNSGLWPSQGQFHWHEGVVTATQGNHAQFYVQTLGPGIPGDSGSAVLTRSGEAVGLLSTLCYAPCAGQNGVVGLQGQLALAKAKTGLEVELVTWAQLDDGALP